MDKTSLAYWFPKLEAAGIPVPKTIIVSMPRGAQECVWSSFDGHDGGDKAAMDKFIADLVHACGVVGYPAFLRTDHTSAKHSWKRSCYVTPESDLRSHVCEIAMYSEMAGIMGLPWDVWAVREFLPTEPLGVCPKYDDMPLCREFRFFSVHGAIRCWHPYWPLEALVRGGADVALYDRLSAADDIDAASALATRVALAVDGNWSIDVLHTKRGWYVTDMAEAHKSFHWSGCEFAEEHLTEDET